MTPRTERSLISSFLVGHLELARLLEDRVEETGLTALEALVTRTIKINRVATPGTIRETLAIRASTAGYVIGRLVERGYVIREPSPIDRRVAILRLTGPGSQVATMVSAAIAELDSEIASVAGIDPTAVNRVVDTIELLASRERRLRQRHW